MNPYLREMVDKIIKDVSFITDDMLEIDYALIEEYVFKYVDNIPGMSNVDVREVKRLVSGYFSDINNFAYSFMSIINSAFSNIDSPSFENDIDKMKRYFSEEVMSQIKEEIKGAILKGFENLDNKFFYDLYFEATNGARETVAPFAVANLKEKIASEMETYLDVFKEYMCSYIEKQAMSIIDEYTANKEKGYAGKKEETQLEHIWDKLKGYYNELRTEIVSNPELRNAFGNMVTYYNGLKSKGVDFKDYGNVDLYNFVNLISEFTSKLQDTLKSKIDELNKKAPIEEEKETQVVEEVNQEELPPLEDIKIDNPFDKFRSVINESEPVKKEQVEQSLNPFRDPNSLAVDNKEEITPRAASLL